MSFNFNNIQFPVEMFLNELDLDELAFLYINNCSKPPYILDKIGVIEDGRIPLPIMTELLRDKSFVKQFNRSSLTEKLIEVINEKSLFDNILEYMYVGEITCLSGGFHADMISILVFRYDVKTILDLFKNESISMINIDRCGNKSKLALSLMIFSYILGITDRFIDLAEREDSDLDYMVEILNFRIKVLEQILDYSILLDKSMSEKQCKALKNMSRNYTDAVRKYETKDKLLKNAKETIKSELAEKKEIKKQLELRREGIPQPEMIARLQEDLKGKDAVIEQLKMNIQDLKEKSQEVLNMTVDNLNDQITDLHRANKEKANEIKEDKKIIYKLANKDIYEELKNYLDKEGFTESLYSIIEPHLKTQFAVKAQSDKVANDSPLDIAENDCNYRIGYCVIENDKHFVVFADGVKEEIRNLTESIYLAQSQFVLVDKEYNYKWSYAYKFEPFFLQSLSNSFAVCYDRDGGIFIDRGNGKFQKLNMRNKDIQLRDKQIVLVDRDNNCLSFYKQLRLNADAFLSSLKIKGHKMYYIIKIFPNGYMVRDIETETESFEQFEQKDSVKEIKEQQIICVAGNEIINVFSSPKFYTLSSLYHKGSIGTVCIKNDRLYAKKDTDEIVLINDLPTFTLTDGQVINLDENNNYLSIIAYSNGESLERKATAFKPIKAANNICLDEAKDFKKVLIIGNENFENAYKLSLFKKGLKADVVDGFAQWPKIRTAAKGKDIIIVVAKFILHDNMFRVKKEITDIPVIYPENDGANFITDEILKELSRKEMIS